MWVTTEMEKTEKAVSQIKKYELNIYCIIQGEIQVLAFTLLLKKVECQYKCVFLLLFRTDFRIIIHPTFVKPTGILRKALTILKKSLGR